MSHGLAAGGPVVAGWLRDLTGSWDATLLLVCGIAVAQSVVVSVRGREARR